MHHFLLALIAAGASAATQQPDTISVRIRVADTATRPIAGAEVFVIHGLNDVRATGVTDTTGARVLRVVRTNDAIEVVARRIGYARTSVFVTPENDTVSVSITLKPAAQALAAVKVTAREDVKRRSYHVDADEIEHSSRLLFDGLDVLTKLKPDILTGRAPDCGVKYVWVNGKWIFDAPINPIARMHLAASGLGGRSRDPRREVVADVASIMASIKPEHIAEMNYVDCFDTSMPGLHAQSALYIVLKLGIAYDPKIGSYVVADTTKR